MNETKEKTCGSCGRKGSEIAECPSCAKTRFVAFLLIVLAAMLVFGAFSICTNLNKFGRGANPSPSRGR